MVSWSGGTRGWLSSPGVHRPLAGSVEDDLISLPLARDLHSFPQTPSCVLTYSPRLFMPVFLYL